MLYDCPCKANVSSWFIRANLVIANALSDDCKTSASGALGEDITC